MKRDACINYNTGVKSIYSTKTCYRIQLPRIIDMCRQNLPSHNTNQIEREQKFVIHELSANTEKSNSGSSWYNHYITRQKEYVKKAISKQARHVVEVKDYLIFHMTRKKSPEKACHPVLQAVLNSLTHGNELDTQDHHQEAGAKRQ